MRSTLLGEEALELARSIGDPRLVREALSALGHATPSPEARRALYLEALACHRQLGDSYSACGDFLMLANLAMDDRDLDSARSHFEEAIAAAEEGGFSQALIGGLWNNLGLVLLYQEEFEEAALLSRKALIASRRRGRRTREGAFELYILACCATRTGNYREAAQLTGAHDAIDAEIIAAVPVGAYWWSPFELEVRNDNRARLREALGEIEFAQAYAIGARLNFEEAIDLALVRSAPA